jgi:hypothetical protein
MLRRCCVIELLLIAIPDVVRAGYLDENPDEVFSSVYERLGALPLRAAQLGKLEATNVPVAIQKVDGKSFGVAVGGLLGMSFLSRFDVQMAGGFIEVRTRRAKQ